MLDIPENIKDLFRSDNNRAQTHKKIKLTFYDDTIDSLYPYELLFPHEGLYPSEHGEPWVVIENNRIDTESLVIIESLSESEDLTFGSCESAMMEITVADVIEDLTGREFTLTVEISGYEMAMGIYTVESYARQSDRRKRKITAYDRMRWFDRDVAGWYNDLEFPVTLKTFRDSLCEYIGITQTGGSLLFDSMQITKTINPAEISGLDILKAICEINGCFGHIDKTGQLKYIQLQQTGLYPSEALFPEENLYPSEFGRDGRPAETVSHYKQPMTYEDYLVEGISSLVIRQQEGDVGGNVGVGENVYTIEGNMLVYGKSASQLLNIAQSLLPYISGRIYRPANIQCYAMPWVEVGDGIIIPTQNDIIETFCMKRTTKGIQAMTDTIESTGNQTRQEVFGINKQITQLEGKMAVIVTNVEEVSATVTDLKENTEAQLKIVSDEISAEVTRATKEEGKLSSSIKINADQIALKVSAGDVTKQLNSELKITGNSIALTTGHFTVNSKNLTITESGDATFSGKVTGSSFVGGSINIGNGNFVVDSGGKVTSKNALIEGATINGAGLVTGTHIVARDTLEGNSCSFEDVMAAEIYCHGTVYGADWQYISDRRYKTNVRPISPKDCYELICSVTPVGYKFLGSQIGGVGFIAQDVKAVLKKMNMDLPLIGYREKDDMYTIPYANYVAILAGAIQYMAERGLKDT